LLRKDVFDVVGYYPEDILQEDFYMWLKISALYKIGYYPHITIKYRQHEKSMSQNPQFTDRIHVDILKVCKLFLDEFPQKENQIILVQKRRLNYFLQKVLHNKLSVEKYINYVTMFTNRTVACELLSNGDIDRPLLDLFLLDKKKCLELIDSNKIKIQNKLYKTLISGYMPVWIPKILITTKRFIFKRDEE